MSTALQRHAAGMLQEVQYEADKYLRDWCNRKHYACCMFDATELECNIVFLKESIARVIALLEDGK